jgi:thiol-disulfide isomerase/thioredoxin
MLRRCLLIAGFLAILMPAVALAAGPQPFDAEAFSAAQAAAKPILVQIDASWCPICAKQRPILAELEKTSEFSDLVVFNIDFDSQKNLVRQFGASMQSTLIVFHGAVEKGRAIGETDPAGIKALLEKSKSA